MNNHLSTILGRCFLAAAMLNASPGLGVVLNPVVSPWIRMDAEVTRLAMDPHGRFIAFIEGHTQTLKVIDVTTRDVFAVTGHSVGAAFFWAPDGFRLFYRELVKGANEAVTSYLKAYDTTLRKSITLDTIHEPTGLLTFDPRDLRMYLMRPKGILTRRLNFPDERLAIWQITQRTDKGRWIATQNGMLWVSQAGLTMRRLADDQSPVESFSVAPDGTTAAWATQSGNLFVSREGAPPQKIDRGRDPAWHPDKPILLYAGARVVGKTIVSYDLKVADLRGSGRYLTTSQFSAERWPQWAKDGKRIIYTIDRTTDLFSLDFNP